MNPLANCSNQSFQDIEFDPPSQDRRGRPIHYQPSCPVSRMGSTTPSLKKLMRTHAIPMITTCQSPKHKVVLGAIQKATTRKRLHRTRPSATQVNDLHFPQTDVQFFDPIFFTVIEHRVLVCFGRGTAISGT